jgi:hypothetical protein
VIFSGYRIPIIQPAQMKHFTKHNFGMNRESSLNKNWHVRHKETIEMGLNHILDDV